MEWFVYDLLLSRAVHCRRQVHFCSALRTNLSPFARCTLKLIRHSPPFLIKIYYASLLAWLRALHPEILTNREMVNFQKLDFLLFFFINCVTSGARELNGIRQTGLDPIIQNAKCESPRWNIATSREKTFSLNLILTQQWRNLVTMCVTSNTTDVETTLRDHMWRQM